MPAPRLPRLGPWAAGLAAATALAVLAGLQTLPALPDPRPWALGALVCGLLAWRWRVLAMPALLAAVLAWGSWWSAAALEPRLPPAWEGRDLVVEAVVDGLPQSLDGFGGAPLWRLTLKPLGPGRDGAHRLPLPARVSVWHETEAPPRGGERWRFTLRLKQVHALQNPGLPDAELWMLERGMGAQGSVRSAERVAAAPWWSLQGARQALRDRLDAQVSAERARALIAGLLLGDQAALPAADWALLRDAGVVHLFAISGLHITAFAWAAGWLIRRAWPAAWALRLPAPLAARWGGLLCAGAYALLAGWGVPAQRTVALLAMVTLLASSGRLWPWPLALLVAALPIALADPWALVQPGFWLSFAAVALLMQQGHPPGPRNAVKDLLHTQAVATLGLAPLSLVFFGQVSLIGAVANLVAVPLVTLLLTPLALLGAVLPPLWQLAAWGSDGLFALLQPLARVPGAVASLPQAPVALQALALAGLPLVALRLPRPVRAAGLLCMLPLLAWRPALPAPGQFELQVLDVGQGSAVLLRTAGHALLFDAGPRWGPRNDAGARVVLPALRALGVDRLDALVLSHGDADHAGGAASLRAGMATGLLWRSPDARLAPLGGRLCARGEGWDWNGVRFDFLHPGSAAGPRANASSCVLRVQAQGGASLLIPADIGATEEAILQTPPSTVLLLPHHGSAGSSSAALLDAAQPQLAFAQAGYRNRHGHPALATQNRLRERGIALLGSADCGAWRWRSTEPPARAGCWRAQRPRYWHRRLPPDTSSVTGPELRPDTIPP